MLDYIFAMGPIGELNMIILLVITIMALRNAYVLFISKKPDRIAKLGRSINAILFWGVITLLMGVFGTFAGASGMTDVLARMPEDAGQIMQITMGGICELLILLNFSLASFIVVVLVWYFLTWRHQKLLTDKLRSDYGRS